MLTTLRIISSARTARARIVCPFECKPIQQRSSRIVSFSSLQRPPPPSIPPYVLGILGIPVLGGVYTYYKYLEDVPMTGRRRWIATSTEWERRLGDQEYRTLKEQFKNQTLAKDHRASVTVQRVGNRIFKAATEFSDKYHIEKK